MIKKKSDKDAGMNGKQANKGLQTALRNEIEVLNNIWWRDV